MRQRVKAASIGAAMIGMTACGATTEQEFVSAVGFGLAQETVRLNPAVVNEYEGSTLADTSLVQVRNRGAATYSGSIAFYDSFGGTNAVTVAGLDQADLMGKMDIDVNIGPTSIVMEGEATNFVDASGRAAPGRLIMTDGRVVNTITGAARITGQIGGQLDRVAGTRPYSSTIGGNFFDNADSLVVRAGTGIATASTDPFSALIGATRD